MTESALHVPGETAVVTAAGSGIGLRIADHLTSAGVDVAVNDIDPEALSNVPERLSDNPGDVITVEGDTGDSGDMEELIESTVEVFGGIDILVNNVGIAGPTKPCEEVTREEFMRTLEINNVGVFNPTKYAIPYLKESNSGRVVNVSSMTGKRPLRDRTPYTTSKMGVIGFTRTLAVELAEYGVNVNSICPGGVDGPRLRNVIREQAETQDKSYEKAEREFREISPKDEFVQPDDIADTVLYLCSDRAESVTGQDLNVTNGVVMY